MTPRWDIFPVKTKIVIVIFVILADLNSILKIKLWSS